ncbi:MAG: hypothetical protein HZA50_00265 [Planctomycetes bacterium]|nr:hypothetical protein [Planctomycetota bacterium]
MTINRGDKDVIQELARRVAEIAALPVQQETVRLWKANNSLKPVRPMVMIDQVCWNEMDVDGELALKCQDEFARDIEGGIRKTLYMWKHFRVDMVVDGMVNLRKAIRSDGFGLRNEEQTSAIDPSSDVVGHFYLDQIKTDEDLEKIRPPHISLDEQATAQTEAKANELLGGILGVRMEGATPRFAPWDEIVQWHGVENTILDLIDRPEFAHRLVRRLYDAHVKQLEQFEAQNLLGPTQRVIHCTGAWTDELPAAGFHPGHMRTKDLWTFGMAQIFTTVSPAMHNEFEIEYSIPWYRRFGLGYYGCCEPLHTKIDIIRRLPNLRKISMSPWVDVEIGASRIGGDYVFSRKPPPSMLATDAWHPDEVEADLKKTLAACARHGCPVELILKDISTVRYQPQRLWEWADIASRLVRR